MIAIGNNHGRSERARGGDLPSRIVAGSGRRSAQGRRHSVRGVRLFRTLLAGAGGLSKGRWRREVAAKAVRRPFVRPSVRPSVCLPSSSAYPISQTRGPLRPALSLSLQSSTRAEVSRWPLDSRPALAVAAAVAAPSSPACAPPASLPFSVLYCCCCKSITIIKTIKKKEEKKEGSEREGRRGKSSSPIISLLSICGLPLCSVSSEVRLLCNHLTCVCPVNVAVTV